MGTTETNMKKLYDAALEGNIESFQKFLKKDPHILDRCMIEKSSAYTQSLLHVATNAGHTDSKELLERKPELPEEVDQVKVGSPLHMASAKDHLAIINTLVATKPRMCFLYDREGKTPIHIAVENGYIQALQVFLQKEPLAVREPTTRGETVLHLCVKFNRLNVLSFLLGIPVVNDYQPNNARDMQGTENRPHPRTTNEESQDNNSGDSRNRIMCLVRDQDGQTPIHVAAANGHIEVLSVLHRANCYAAQERTINGESILHLCVKHNQLHALKKLIELTEGDGDQLINSKDNDGNTILHLAVACKQCEMVEYLVGEKCKSSIEINAVNNKDMTVADVYMKISKKDAGDGTIEKYLKRVKAKQAKDTLYDQAERLENQRSALMVVASLIATMAFQAGMNPPGGVYPETEKGDHEAGFAIWPYYSINSYYNIALISNTVGFVASISVITLLISGLPFKREYLITILRVTLWIAAVATSITYNVVLNYVTKADDPPLTNAIKYSYMVWVYVMVFILFGNVAGFFWRRKDCFKNCCAPRNIEGWPRASSLCLPVRNS